MDNIINYYIMTNSTGQAEGNDTRTGYIILAVLSAVVVISLILIVIAAVKDLRSGSRYPRPRKLRRLKK